LVYWADLLYEKPDEDLSAYEGVLENTPQAVDGAGDASAPQPTHADGGRVPRNAPQAHDGAFGRRARRRTATRAGSAAGGPRARAAPLVSQKANHECLPARCPSLSFRHCLRSAWRHTRADPAHYPAALRGRRMRADLHAAAYRGLPQHG